MWGQHCQHAPASTATLERVLNAYRPSVIVEIGSLFGGITAYIGTWAFLNGRAHVLSLDMVPCMTVDVRDFLGRIGVVYWYEDAWKPDTVAKVFEYIMGRRRDGRALIYCDGGDKTRELALYSKTLDAGDVIGCHDYTTEVAIGGAAEALGDGWQPILDIEQVRAQRLLQMFWEKKG